MRLSRMHACDIPPWCGCRWTHPGVRAGRVARVARVGGGRAGACSGGAAGGGAAGAVQGPPAPAAGPGACLFQVSLPLFCCCPLCTAQTQALRRRLFTSSVLCWSTMQHAPHSKRLLCLINNLSCDLRTVSAYNEAGRCVKPEPSLYACPGEPREAAVEHAAREAGRACRTAPPGPAPSSSSPCCALPQAERWPPRCRSSVLLHVLEKRHT